MPDADLAALSLVVLTTTFLLAFAFGAIVQRTNFCTMGGVADIVSFGDWTRMRQWPLAIAVAIFGTTLLDVAGLIDVKDSFYTAPRFTPIAHAVGGALFGFGMVLTGGCGSKSLVRAGGGSLKSLVALLVLAAAAGLTPTAHHVDHGAAGDAAAGVGGHARGLVDDDDRVVLMDDR